MLLFKTPVLLPPNISKMWSLICNRMGFIYAALCFCFNQYRLPLNLERIRLFLGLLSFLPSQISEKGQMKHVIKVALLVLSTQKAMDSRDRYITALIKLPFQYISQLNRPLITAFSRLLKFVGKQNILCRDKDKKKMGKQL